MKIIEIEALDNGAHRNQAGDVLIPPKGWAEIPDDMTIPDTFPFVNIEVAEETRYKESVRYDDTIGEVITEKEPYTVMVVTSMTAGVMPEPAPLPEPEPSTDDVLNILLGVE